MPDYSARNCRRHPKSKRRQELGIRLGNWLSAKEARDLWQSPDAESLKGKRDRAIIAVLLRCGLRRIASGKLFRCVCRSGTVWGEGMTEKVVWHVVKMHARKLDMPK